MRENQDRNQHDRDDHLAENQRIGKQIAQDPRYQNRNQEYRSGHDYHNNPDPRKEGGQHYGADPNSAYRRSNINYGDGRDHRDGNSRGQNNQQHHQQNRERDWNQDNRYQENRYRENRFNQDNRNQNNYQSHNRDNRYDENRFNRSDNQFYQGEEPRLMDDRKHFQAEDYRYGSGNRQWESPGYERHQDQDNDDDRNYSRDRERRDGRGFFGRIADEIREDWRTFTHPNDDQNQYNQGRRPEPRNGNRGYESGPRWADEDDSWNSDRRRGRNHDEDYNRR